MVHLNNQQVGCKYCQPTYQKSARIVLRNEHFLANFDNHPVSPGHMKIVSIAHRDALDELTGEEYVSLVEMIKRVKALIRQQRNPDGWNIGCNEGKAAGQTVMHLHIHVIPRYTGDVENPRGGVRTILPGGDYLAEQD